MSEMIVGECKKDPANSESWGFKLLFWSTIAVIVAAGAGVGWGLGALIGWGLEALGITSAVFFGGIVGGVIGLGVIIYLIIRPSKPHYTGLRATMSEEEADKKRRKHGGLILEHRGWDYYISDLGKCETMTCPICKEVMEVERDVPGTPSYVNAVFGLAWDHDFFWCKFRKESWHLQVLELLKMAESTPSSKLQQLLEEEIQTVLKDRKPTKKSWRGFP
jgi:hypothetical protein